MFAIRDERDYVTQDDFMKVCGTGTGRRMTAAAHVCRGRGGGSAAAGGGRRGARRRVRVHADAPGARLTPSPLRVYNAGRLARTAGGAQDGRGQEAGDDADVRLILWGRRAQVLRIRMSREDDQHTACVATFRGARAPGQVARKLAAARPQCVLPAYCGACTRSAMEHGKAWTRRGQLCGITHVHAAAAAESVR